MSSWKHTFIGIVLGLLISAAILLVSQPPRGTTIPLQTRALGNLAAYGASAANQPGVVSLPRFSRKPVAAQAAGDFSDPARLDAVNLAALRCDGQKVFIPSLLAAQSPPPVTPPARNAPTLTLTQPCGAPIKIKTTQSQELDRLPEIGPTKTVAIILYRQAHGLFGI